MVSVTYTRSWKVIYPCGLCYLHKCIKFPPKRAWTTRSHPGQRNLICSYPQPPGSDLPALGLRQYAVISNCLLLTHEAPRETRGSIYSISPFPPTLTHVSQVPTATEYCFPQRNRGYPKGGGFDTFAWETYNTVQCNPLNDSEVGPWDQSNIGSISELNLYPVIH